MTQWLWMKKEGIDEPALVTRESFRMCHEPHGWVEYTPPAPEILEDVQPPADNPNESNQDSPTPRRRSATPKE